MAELGDAELDIACWSRQQLRAMPVALRQTIRSAFPMPGTDRRRQLGFDQLLERGSEDVAQRGGQGGIGAGEARGKVG